jgi:hypothetical protein
LAFSRAGRAADAAVARKARKRAWLRRMYAEGLARERPAEGDPEDGGGGDRRRAGDGAAGDAGPDAGACCCAG